MVGLATPRRWVQWCLGAGRSVRNRRGSRRFTALSQPAQIGWMEGENFVTAPATLKDVSLSGLSATTSKTLAKATPAWVLLSGHPSGRWVKTVVVEVKRVKRELFGGKAEYLIRMRYGLGCPYTFFRAAVGSRERLVPETASGERATLPNSE